MRLKFVWVMHSSLSCFHILICPRSVNSLAPPFSSGGFRSNQLEFGHPKIRFISDKAQKRQLWAAIFFPWLGTLQSFFFFFLSDYPPLRFLFLLLRFPSHPFQGLSRLLTFLWPSLYYGGTIRFILTRFTNVTLTTLLYACVCLCVCVFYGLDLAKSEWCLEANRGIPASEISIILTLALFFFALSDPRQQWGC